MLNLSVIANSQGGTSVKSTSRFSGIRFASNNVLGNIGAPLRVGGHDGDDISESLDESTTGEEFSQFETRDGCHTSKP